MKVEQPHDSMESIHSLRVVSKAAALAMVIFLAASGQEKLTVSNLWISSLAQMGMSGF